MVDEEGNFEFEKEGIILNPRKLNLKIESETKPTQTIMAYLMKIGGDITWTSSDPNVATVTGTGKNATITAVAKGTATITASCGTYSDECEITVKAVPIGLKIGSEVSYSPSGTYIWQAKYASSDLGVTNDILLDSNTADFQITKWRVLDIDEETDIVKMVPVTPTTGRVALSGAQGYNNAVKLLNNACSNLYASEGVTARSIVIEDIEELYTPEAIEERNNYINTKNSTESVKYGERYTTAYSNDRNAEGEYTSRKSYPVMYEREIDSIIKTAPEIAEGKETNLELSKQTQWIERSEGGTTGKKTASISIHPKQTNYNLGVRYDDFRPKFKNYASIVLPNGSNTNYWVASRCVSLYSNACDFCVRYVTSGYLYAFGLYSSNSIGNYKSSLFPVVSLSSEFISEDGAGNFVVEVE